MRTEEAPVVGKRCSFSGILLVQVLPILSVVELVDGEVAGVIIVPTDLGLRFMIVQMSFFTVIFCFS